MSTAYLATAHFKDQDALSARIIQARFTGHFRFACQAFLEFMSDPTTSGAGSNNPEVSAFANPDDYTSQYDRNWLVMASALFSESYYSETGHDYPTTVLGFWRDNCELPAVERSAVPTNLWKLDKKVYGEEDLFAHAVPVHSYAPLRAFGSLRQLRNVVDGGNGEFYSEDYTNMVTTYDFTEDRTHRRTESLQSLYRERICNPTYKYSINDAIGNPPVGSNDEDQSNFIRDASRAKLPRWDMAVPNGMLGASGIRRPHPEGCGLGIESGGCNPWGAPSYAYSSLWQWAYVTSSQCDSTVQTNTHTHPRLTFAPGVCAATQRYHPVGTVCSTSRRSRSPRAAPTADRRASRRSTAQPWVTISTLLRRLPQSSWKSRWSASGTTWPRNCVRSCPWARPTPGASSSCRSTESTTWTL